MLEHLPAPGDYFGDDERKLWLQMVELSFKIIYSDVPPDDNDPNEPAAMRQHGS